MLVSVVGRWQVGGKLQMASSPLLMPVLLYGSETMICREKDRSRIRVVQMDYLRGLLGIRRIDRVLNLWFRKLWWVAKGTGESNF